MVWPVAGSWMMPCCAKTKDKSKKIKVKTEHNFFMTAIFE
jgi:hypothetical protein